MFRLKTTYTLEEVAHRQVLQYRMTWNLIDEFQSVFRPAHTTVQPMSLPNVYDNIDQFSDDSPSHNIGAVPLHTNFSHHSAQRPIPEKWIHPVSASLQSNNSNLSYGNDLDVWK